MMWSVALPGQPPTLNSLYTVVPRTAADGHRYKGIGKSRDAQRWHDEMVMIIRNAKPSGWLPELGSFVRLRVRLFLDHDIDADNVLKVLSDAFETATGINDRRFLPEIACKHLVASKYARVEVDVLEEAPHSHAE